MGAVLARSLRQQDEVLFHFSAGVHQPGDGRSWPLVNWLHGHWLWRLRRLRWICWLRWVWSWIWRLWRLRLWWIWGWLWHRGYCPWIWWLCRAGRYVAANPGAIHIAKRSAEPEAERQYAVGYSGLGGYGLGLGGYSSLGYTVPAYSTLGYTTGYTGGYGLYNGYGGYSGLYGGAYYG